MKKTALLNKLDKVVNKAANLAITACYPIPNNKNGAWVGNTIISKNDNDFYDILTLDKKSLYNNICVFDVAVIVAQRYNNGEAGVIRTVLGLEERYSKYRTDMVHYLHCMRAAKLKNDYDTMAVLEDKFQVSEIRAKSIRDNITFFKRLRPAQKR